mmetsp:Transcript_2175/g.8503  ORF Transcript_2175/g.8503 Transcript_2175/m.8503 type:complete len:227 (-) Transcript_2175:1634-2314(-)
MSAMSKAAANSGATRLDCRNKNASARSMVSPLRLKGSPSTVINSCRVLWPGPLFVSAVCISPSGRSCAKPASERKIGRPQNTRAKPSPPPYDAEEASDNPAAKISQIAWDIFSRIMSFCCAARPAHLVANVVARLGCRSRARANEQSNVCGVKGWTTSWRVKKLMAEAEIAGCDWSMKRPGNKRPAMPRSCTNIWSPDLGGSISGSSFRNANKRSPPAAAPDLEPS